MNTIFDLLDQADKQIQHLKTPSLRAESMIPLIRTQKSNYSNTDLLAATLKGTVEMIDAMSKVEITSDFDICIGLLEHYLQTGNFNVEFITKPRNTSEEKRYRDIKEKLQLIVGSPEFE